MLIEFTGFGYGSDSGGGYGIAGGWGKGMGCSGVGVRSFCECMGWELMPVLCVSRMNKNGCPNRSSEQPSLLHSNK